MIAYARLLQRIEQVAFGPRSISFGVGDEEIISQRFSQVTLRSLQVKLFLVSRW